MLGLAFEQDATIVASAPLRTDIACFVGFIRRRPGRTLPGLDRWRADYGWTGPYLPTESIARSAWALESAVTFGPGPLPWQIQIGDEPERVDLPEGEVPIGNVVELINDSTEGVEAALDREGCLTLRALQPGVLHLGRQPVLGFPRATVAQPGDHLPVPVDSWDAFDHLFDWNSRPLDTSEGSCPTLLGAAVRSYFAQGGRKCYVVRVGDPWPVSTPGGRRKELARRLLSDIVQPLPVDRTSWSGLGHILGLPDVSIACLPDLPDLMAADAIPPQPEPHPPHAPEVFVECSGTTAPADAPRPGRIFRAPRCDEDGFAAWAAFVQRAAGFVRSHAREVQLVAALPLPVNDPARAAAAEDAQREAVGGMETAFLQLAYPWLRTTGAQAMPEGVESPDGVLAGVLSRNALVRGTFFSAGRQALLGAVSLEPVLGTSELQRELPTSPFGRVRTVLERISVMGPTPSGLRLLSDVTTAADESYRPANINRLVSALVRAARQLGETETFATAGEDLWARLRAGLEDLLTRFWLEGALAGATAAEAFDVRCDRTTMTQNDVDAGRVIAEVRFTAAAPIEEITVVLSVDESGQMSARPAEADGADL